MQFQGQTPSQQLKLFDIEDIEETKVTINEFQKMWGKQLKIL